MTIIENFLLKKELSIQYNFNKIIDLILYEEEEYINDIFNEIEKKMVQNIVHFSIQIRYKNKYIDKFVFLKLSKIMSKLGYNCSMSYVEPLLILSFNLELYNV